MIASPFNGLLNVVFIAVGAPRYIVVEFVVHYRNLCTRLACVRAVIPLSPVAKLSVLGFVALS